MRGARRAVVVTPEKGLRTMPLPSRDADPRMNELRLRRQRQDGKCSMLEGHVLDVEAIGCRRGEVPQVPAGTTEQHPCSYLTRGPRRITSQVGKHALEA